MKKFGLKSASSVRTSMSPNGKLTVDLLGKSVDSSLYRSMISSLLYDFTLQLVDLTLVIVWECVLDIRLIPKSLI